MLELYANNARSTLAAAMNAEQAWLNITDPTGFPTTGQFRIIIDAEIMLVTGVGGSIYTITFRKKRLLV
jgi:hypothetical protein